MAKLKSPPEGMTAVTPHLVIAGAAAAIDFYKKAFGATEEARLAGPDGKLMHGLIRINGAAVMVVDENPEWGALGPKLLKGTPVSIHLYVDDADAFVKKAVEAGATVTMPLDDAFWGDRFGVISDPFGHSWSVAHPQKIVKPEDLPAAMAASFGNCGDKPA